MKLAIAVPTGLAVALLTAVGLGLLIGLAIPIDIDLAIFFATKFGGTLIGLAILYFVTERKVRQSS
jgi:hypothetical protein